MIATRVRYITLNILEKEVITATRVTPYSAQLPEKGNCLQEAGYDLVYFCDLSGYLTYDL